MTLWELARKKPIRLAVLKKAWNQINERKNEQTNEHIYTHCIKFLMYRNCLLCFVNLFVGVQYFTCGVRNCRLVGHWVQFPGGRGRKRVRGPGVELRGRPHTGLQQRGVRRLHDRLLRQWVAERCRSYRYTTGKVLGVWSCRQSLILLLKKTWILKKSKVTKIHLA